MMKPKTLCLSLFLLSFGFALYSITVLKLLSYLAIPPPIFILLLLGGIPLGGLLTLKFFTYEEKSLVTLLWIALGVVALTSLVGIYPSKLIYSLFPVYEFFINLRSLINKWFVLIVLGALAFSPFFIIYGAAEFLGYRIGLKYINNKIVYSLYLLGTMCAFILFRQTIALLGLCHMMLIAAITFCSIMLLIDRTGLVKKTVALGACIAVFFVPQLERLYLRVLTLPESYSLLFDKQENYRMLYSGWSRYCQFTLVDNVRTGDIYGVVNGINLWGFPYRHFAALTLDYAPFELISEQATIAIIGPGGGRQVPLALAKNPKEVVAIELIPDVIEVLKNKFPGKNLHAYTDPRVTTVTMDGKKYFEQTDKQFDLILIPHAEGGAVFARTIFEPSETLYTIETIRNYKKHLKPGGILAINKHQSINIRGILFKQYLTALNSEGFITYGYRKNDFVIIAHKDVVKKRLPPAYVKKVEAEGFTYCASLNEVVPVATDNNPFRLGAFVEYFGTQLFRKVLLAFCGGFAILIIGAFIAFKRHFQRIQAYTPQFFPLCLQSILVGINFILLENYLIFLLYRYLDNPLDAIYSGSILFLLCAAIGSFFIKNHGTVVNYVLAFLAAAVLYVGGNSLPSAVTILLLMPLMVYTGTFFPSIFFGHKKRLILIFVMDTLGTIIGGIISTLGPMFWGFSLYFRWSLIGFAVCYLILLKNTGDILPADELLPSNGSDSQVHAEVT